LPNAHRFLGFGFAAADLLLEISGAGKVVFGLGAGKEVLGVADTALSGRAWKTLIHADDHPMLEALFNGLGDTTRAGPVVVSVAVADGAPARYATITAIRLPQNDGAISCSLARAKARGAAGVQSRESFEARAAELLAGSSQDLELAFVELTGLSTSDAALKNPAKLQALVAGVLRAQAYRGEAPTSVGQDRYAMVRDREESTEVMAARIDRVLASSGVEGVTTQTGAMAMTGIERPRQVTQALRYALNQVLEKGLEGGLPSNFSEALDSAMKTTLSKAGQLGAAIKYKRFTLAFQPVVALKDTSLHHHEVLVRFGAEGSPFPTIKMAEELDLIAGLDGAILEETLTHLLREPELLLAVNVSGRSLMSDGYVEGALKLVAQNPSIKGRLLFELTESAAVEDLAEADRRLQSLRAAGCQVCLDDFGAGAASLAYLQQLTLDLLKIDGRYIRDLQHGGREATFVRHLVNMCAELKVATLAEMVEGKEAEEAIRKAGVDYAQGWLYGRAGDAPINQAQLTAFLAGGAGVGSLALRAAAEKRKEWG